MVERLRMVEGRRPSWPIHTHCPAHPQINLVLSIGQKQLSAIPAMPRISAAPPPAISRNSLELPAPIRSFAVATTPPNSLIAL
jgi:hypothetical protein